MLPWAQEFRAITEKAAKYDESGAEALLNLLSDVFEFTDDCWGFVPKESESHSGLTRERLMSLKNRARALGLRV